MKKIIQESNQTEILINDLQGREIVAYPCANSSSIAILSRITKNQKPFFGFVNLSSPTAEPTYIAENFFDCIKLAIKNRKLLVFENQTELISAIYNNKI